MGAKIEIKKEKKKEKVETAILSVSTKKKGKETAKTEEKKEMETDDKKDEDNKEDDKKEKEPKFSVLENPTRALPSQLKLLSTADGSKYKPIKSVQSGGIILVENSKPEEEEVLVERVAAGGPKTEE